MSDRGIIMKNIPEFVNREKDKEKVKRLLSGRPNLVYFVYGPINSGKTTLLMKVFEELPENYCVFYINFRWRDVQRVIGGKLGDMVRFYEKKKQGYSEKDALESMFRDARNTIEWMMDLSGEGEKEGLQVREIKIFLEKFKVDEERKYKDVKGKVLKFLIDKNILFFNSVEGIVRPQSRLLWKAIKNVDIAGES